jgi:choline dehydrogenase-like flavoprotein
MPFLSERERLTLRAVCQALVPPVAGEAPSSVMGLGAQDLELARRFEEALEAVATPRELSQLRILLRLLSVPAINGFLEGQWRAFDQLSLAGQTRVLRGWMTSRFNLRRQAFQAVKRMGLFLFYAAVPDGSDGNPTWPAFNYSPPPEPPDVDRGIHPIQAHPGQDLSADVVVVGSGAGGGMIAAELSAAGLDVLVVEKGGYRSASDFDGYELDGNANLFEKGGALTTSDLGMVVLAGSTLGGGTVVNWSTSLPTPDEVRREWAADYGFEGVDGPAYQSSLDRAGMVIHAHPGESDPNGQNQALARGAAALGYDVQVIDRNVDGCKDCSYCMFGCRYHAKQSGLVTTLLDASRRGARILVNCRVDRVRIAQGQAVGIEGRLLGVESESPITVRSKAVVVCAGAIHTPALLLRSGMRNPNIGKHLHLHPVTAPVGAYGRPIRSWQGPPQTRLSEALADMDGRGYGVRLEVAPAHPGLWASALPWSSGIGHKRLMAHVDRLANVIAIVRDRGSGRVALDGDGRPTLHYRLDPYDARHMQRGLEAAIRVHRAAGAKRILSPHTVPAEYQADRDGFEAYLEVVRSKSLAANDVGLFSAHQMGSCRIAGDRRRGAVRPDGEAWEVAGLFVADGSVFPTACGVNPMVPILATAHYLSSAMVSKLT